MSKEISREKYLNKLMELKDKYYYDKEVLYLKADEILFELLVDLGYEDIVEAYGNLGS